MTDVDLLSTAELQADLQFPWFGGLGTLEDVGAPGALPVAIGGRPFLIDPKKYERGFVDAYRQAQDTSQIPGEQTLTTEGVWTRYGRDWRYGAGQARFDRPDSDRRRYSDSLGVNPWEEGKLSLLTKTVRVLNENKTYKRILTGRNGQIVVVTTDAVRVGSGTWPSLVWTTVTGLPATSYTDATMDDDEVWVATGAGIWKFPLTTMAAVRYDGDSAGATKAWDSVILVNGRLVGGSGPDLWEIYTGVTNSVSRHHHPSPAFRWTVLFGHPSWIYAGGSLGSVSELFRFGVDQSTGNLLPGVPSLFLPGGEVLRAGVHYVKTVIIATSKGVRLCEVTNGELNYGRVVAQPGDVRCVTASEDYVWFGWTGIATSRTGMGRCAPGRFGDAEGAVPAWARDVWWEGSGIVSGCTVHAGRIVFAVDTVGLMIAGDELVDSGWLETGVVDFDIPYTVQPLDVTLRHAPLHGTIAVQWRPFGTDAWTDNGVSGLPNTRVSSPLSFPFTQAAGMELRFTLTRAAAASGPVLHQWLLRVSPQPSRIEQIGVPLIFADRLKARQHNAPVYVFDPLAAWNFLADLIRDGGLIIYQEGPSAYQVKIKDLQLRDVQAWSLADEFFAGTVFLILQVVR